MFAWPAKGRLAHAARLIRDGKTYVPTGRSIPLIRRGNLYFVGMRIRQHETCANAVSDTAEALPPMPNSFLATSEQKLAALWAARLHAKSRGIRSTALATSGTGRSVRLNKKASNTHETPQRQDAEPYY